MYAFQNFKSGAKLYSIVALMSVAMIFAGLIGLFLAKQSNKGLETVYKDRVVCLQQLKVISDMYAVNIVDTTHKLREGTVGWSDGRRNLDEAHKPAIVERKGVRFGFLQYTARWYREDEQLATPTAPGVAGMPSK